MSEDFHVQDKILTSKQNIIKKYTVRTVGTFNLWELFKIELYELFFMWVPGAIGLVLRGLFIRIILKKCGGKNFFSHHVSIRGGKKITIGRNVFIDSYSALDVKDFSSKGIDIGNNTYIKRNSFISSGLGQCGYVQIGNNCSIGAGVIIHGHGGVLIGDNVMIAAQTYIVSSSHVFSDINRSITEQGFTAKGIVIEDDVWLGAGVKVLDGVKIGKGSIVGAGTVVTKNIEANSIAVGAPAKVIKKRN